MKVFVYPQATPILNFDIAAYEVSHVDVEYDTTIHERVHREWEKLRLENVRPLAILCGRRAYVSIVAFGVWLTMIDRYVTTPDRLRVSGWDAEHPPKLLDLPAYFVPGQDPDWVGFSCGMDAVSMELRRR